MVNMVTLGVVTVLFVAATIYLGWYGYKSTRDNDQFLLGRNKSNPLLIALSYGATFLSASAIVGFGGMGAKYGLVIMWLTVLCLVVGTILAFAVYGKRTRRIGAKLGAYTFADLLGKIFHSPGIRTTVSIIVLVGMPIYCAAVLIGGVNFVSVTMGIDKDATLFALSLIVALYVTFGGVIAVMYNDALQAGIMFFGMAIILVFSFWKLGGVTEAFESLGTLWEVKVANGAFSDLVSNGMNGWTEAPSFGTPIWLTVVTTLLMGVGVGSLAQPQLAVRFMSAKDDRTINRSMWIGSIFIMLILGTAFTIGPLSNVLFYELHGLTATEYLSNSDLIIPTFVNELFADVTFGDVFISVFILALVCASISTMAALLHTMGSSAGYDLWGQIKERRGQKQDLAGGNVKSLKASRICTLIMILVVVLEAYVMPDNIIAKATTIFMGLTAAAILPTFTYGVFSKRPNTIAAKASIIVGAVSWSIWAFFIERGTSNMIGLCDAIFGKPYLFDGLVGFVDPLIIGLTLSSVTLVVVWAVCRLTGRDGVPEGAPSLE
ncbi:MAG: sodium:solute symporter family protein [Candidatus Methanomethylophilaceae archaeon]|nr:sodium:solute symporter family protein [Candidatus Methanomethylophilaceae archaeon]